MGLRLLRWFWQQPTPAFVAAGTGRVIRIQPAHRTIRVPVVEDALIRPFEPKPPAEVDSINFDFSERLAARGDTLASVTSLQIVNSPGAALDLSGPAHANGVVSAEWSAGTLGETYTLECVVTTTAGRTWSCRATVLIAH
jgi:hypothetical protein